MAPGVFCPSCGATSPPGSNFCVGCHRHLRVVRSTGPPAPTSSSHRAIIAVLVLVIVVLLLLFVIPLPYPFSFAISNPGSAVSSTCIDHTFQAGAAVSFTWSSADGSSVTLSVVDPAGHTVYTDDASTGSGSFTAQGSSYQICIYDWNAASVTGSGTADAPFL